MTYQTPKTIKETLDEITNRSLVLPAIQREFVWRPSQICRLFDSLMQGYPFGTFLYWRVSPENSGNFQFYDFILDYHEKNNPHNSRLPNMSDKQLTAVLDGQQRLTSLNIGLRGSAAWKLPRLWRNNPNAFPTRKLYLNLLWVPDVDDEEGLKYRFEFLTENRDKTPNDEECWFRVGDILQMSNAGPTMTRWLNERLPQDRVDGAHDALYELFQVVHNKPLIAYYQEDSQKLDKVLQIFIRMNSGGTVLSYSDMLLSVAVAQWKEHDAREEIHTLVDDLNEIGSGFTISKDLVLKAGLMLSDIASVGFKVDNFNRENMSIFESSWDNIKRALRLTVRLISDFGFNGQNLAATNAMLPIAYYLYKRAPSDSYLTHSDFAIDRQAIREWLIRSLLKSGVWGSGLDTLLTALRQNIRESTTTGFPVEKIYEEMARRGRSLTFEEEEIEDLVDMQYGNRLSFGLLTLLFPFLELENSQFHVDHVFPAAEFTKSRLRKAGVPDEKMDDFIQIRNGLANLQLLLGQRNLEKSSKMPYEWLEEAYDDATKRQDYQSNHLLGEVPESITEFDRFYSDRRERLKARITELLGRQPRTAASTE